MPKRRRRDKQKKQTNKIKRLERNAYNDPRYPKFLEYRAYLGQNNLTFDDYLSLVTHVKPEFVCPRTDVSSIALIDKFEKAAHRPGERSLEDIINEFSRDDLSEGEDKMCELLSKHFIEGPHEMFKEHSIKNALLSQLKTSLTENCRDGITPEIRRNMKPSPAETLEDVIAKLRFTPKSWNDFTRYLSGLRGAGIQPIEIFINLCCYKKKTNIFAQCAFKLLALTDETVEISLERAIHGYSQESNEQSKESISWLSKALFSLAGANLLANKIKNAQNQHQIERFHESRRQRQAHTGKDTSCKTETPHQESKRIMGFFSASRESSTAVDQHNDDVCFEDFKELGKPVMHHW